MVLLLAALLEEEAEGLDLEVVEKPVCLHAKVEVPVECVTSCCFGGENWDELYITTSSRDLDDAGRVAQPLAGGLFRCQTGVGGPPTNLFLG